MILQMFVAADAFAVQRYCISSTSIAVKAISTFEGTAHLLIANPTDCSAMCLSYGNRMSYIEFSDKDVFAEALTAAYSRTPVLIAWEDSAPSKGGTGHSVTCRVVGISN